MQRPAHPGGLPGTAAPAAARGDPPWVGLMPMGAPKAALASPPPAHRGRYRREMLREDGLARLGLEGRLAAEHLIDDGGERVDVRRLGCGKPTDLLGREVLRRRLLGDDALHGPRVAPADQLHV